LRPLVSIITPAYNARETLPTAIASLLAQSCRDWEWIFVDDGSTDESFQWVQELPDPRFRRFRSEANRGRGAARQFALEQAGGRYLCMLDADDWYYPSKIQKQVDCMESDPSLILAGADLAITDQFGRLSGVRRSLRPSEHIKPQPSNVCFAPSIIRVDVARQVGFDSLYRSSEDRDFLARLLPAGSYNCLAEPLYAYSEFASVSLPKLLAASRSARGQTLNGRFNPIARLTAAAIYSLKSLVYRAAFAAGQQQRLIRARSMPPRPSEVEGFNAAWSSVRQSLQNNFGAEHTSDPGHQPRTLA
jgi:glycosyltransferase involved in cell wall biosynthesis